MAEFVTSDGLTLHYTDEGAGVPVLCLAGLTRTTADFDYVTPHLPDARLIKLDYRGRGKSQWDTTWQNYNLFVESRDAVELLDHLGLEKVGVIGTSRGGLIAMGLAMGAKDRLLGVALNDIGPVIEPVGLEFIMGYLGRKPQAKNHVEAAHALERNMTGFRDVPFSRWMEEVTKHFVATDDGLDITYDPKLRDAVIEQGAQAAPDLWPFFAAFAHMPVALLRGANSDLLSAEVFEKMQQTLPQAHAATVADRGHIPFLDEPEALETLKAWVKEMTDD